MRYDLTNDPTYDLVVALLDSDACQNPPETGAGASATGTTSTTAAASWPFASVWPEATTCITVPALGCRGR